MEKIRKLLALLSLAKRKDVRKDPEVSESKSEDDGRIPPEVLERAALLSVRNKQFLKLSHHCVCFACSTYFFSEEIEQYSEMHSAHCPYCHRIAVLPSGYGIPFSQRFLVLMRLHVFRSEEEAEKRADTPA